VDYWSHQNSKPKLKKHHLEAAKPPMPSRFD